MPSDRSWLARAGQSLADRLDRLRDHLDTLQSRLREEVARAMAQTAAGAVRDAVAALLGEGRARLRVPGRYPAGYWGTAAEDSWDQDPDDLEDVPRPAGGRCIWDPAAPPDKHQPLPGRWGPALAVGLQVLSWGLRQQAGLWAALAFGLGATLAAYLAGAALAGSACTLLALGGAINYGAALPTRPAAY